MINKISFLVFKLFTILHSMSSWVFFFSSLLQIFISQVNSFYEDGLWLSSPKLCVNYSFQSHIYINVNQFIFRHSTVSFYSFRYPYFYKGQNMNMSLYYILFLILSVYTHPSKKMSHVSYSTLIVYFFQAY